MDVERSKFDHSLYREMDLLRHIKDSTQAHGFQVVLLIYEGLPLLDHSVYCVVPVRGVDQGAAHKVAIACDSHSRPFDVRLYYASRKEQKEKADEFKLDHVWIARSICEAYEELVYESDEHNKVVRRVNEKYRDISMSVRYKKNEWGQGDALSTGGWDKKLIDHKVVSRLDEDNVSQHEVYK